MERDFSLLKRVQTYLAVQPANCLLRPGCYYLWPKQQSGAEVKNSWNNASIPIIPLLRAQKNITFRTTPLHQLSQTSLVLCQTVQKWLMSARPSPSVHTWIIWLGGGGGGVCLSGWGEMDLQRLISKTIKLWRVPPPSPRIKGRRFVINTGLRPSFLPFYGLCDTWRLFRHRALFL